MLCRIVETPMTEAKTQTVLGNCLLHLLVVVRLWRRRALLQISPEAKPLLVSKVRARAQNGIFRGCLLFFGLFLAGPQPWVLSAQQNLDLRPQTSRFPQSEQTNPTEDFAAPLSNSELRQLAGQWLQSLTALSPPAPETSLAPGRPSLGLNLREASDEEAELLRAIEQLAAYYGFVARRRPLNQIKTMHSFSSNLEVRLPARLGGGRLGEQQLPDELWQQIYRNKREVVFFTPISGRAELDIVSLLLLMALSAHEAPPLPLRLVFLGSELSPPDLSRPLVAARSNSDDLNDPDYPKGSRSFLYHYQLPRPYGAVYLYHQQQELPLSEPLSHILSSFLGQTAAQLRRSGYRFLAGLLPSQISAPGNDPGTEPSYREGIPCQIMYTVAQTPASEARQLGRALGQSGLQYSFNNGFRFFNPLHANPGLFQPYLEEQWALSVLYQAPHRSAPQRTQQASQLALALQRLPYLKLKQALNEATVQPQNSADPVRRGQSLPAGAAENGRHYWLWSFPGPASGKRDFYLSEHRLLLLLLFALLLFSLSSLHSYRQLRQLRALYQVRSGSLLLRILFLFTLVGIYILLANETLLFLLQLLPSASPRGSNGILGSARIAGHIAEQATSPVQTQSSLQTIYLGAAILLKINLILLFFHCHVLGSRPGRHQVWQLAARLLPYTSQCLSFAIMLWLLWLDFSLALVGLYLFSLSILYALSPQSLGKNSPLQFVQNHLKQFIRLLMLLPYIWLLFRGPAPPSHLLSLTLSRNITAFLLTLLLLLPALLLHFSQIQHLRHSRRCRSYLLRRILFHGGNILLGLAVILWVGRVGTKPSISIESAANNRIHTEPNTANRSSNPSLRLEEFYILPPNPASDAEPANKQGSYGHEIAAGRKILRLFLSDSFRFSDWNLFDLSSQFPQGQLLLLSPGLPPHRANGARLVLQRALLPSERDMLRQLGRQWFSSSSSKIRQNYSVRLRLQSPLTLSRLDARLRARNLDLLFASQPFSPARPVPASPVNLSAGLSSESNLLMGFYPPQNLAIEFLLGREPQQLQLHYNLEFSVPDWAGQDALRQEVLARELLPLLSELRLHYRKDSRYITLEPERDFLYIIRIEGLQKPLSLR